MENENLPEKFDVGVNIDILVESDRHEDRAVGRLLKSLHRKVDKLSVDVTQLNNTIEELNDEVGVTVTELGELATQIEGLEVGQITQDQVDELQHKAAQAMESLKAGVSEAKSKVESTSTPEVEPTPAEEQQAPQPTKPLYQAVEGASTDGIDTTRYTTAPFVTEEGGTLFYFSGDSDGVGREGATNGVNDAYAVYTGEIKAAA